MGAFLYYIPKRQAADADTIAAAGLAYAITPSIAHRGTSGGPDGAAGVIVAQGDAKGVGYFADAQTWLQAPGSEFWIGYTTDDPPGPDDLARAKQIAGHEVELGDEKRWLVPVARALDGTSPLPRRLAFDGKQWAPGDILARYTDLFGEACRVWELIAGASDEEVTISDECGIAVMALAVNYRLGPVEISMLGLFDTQTEAEVLKALVDWPTFEAFKKKLASGEITLPPGDEA